VFYNLLKTWRTEMRHVFYYYGFFPDLPPLLEFPVLPVLAGFPTLPAPPALPELPEEPMFPDFVAAFLMILLFLFEDFICRFL